MKYLNVLSRVFNQPHLIRPTKLEAIVRVALNRSAGFHADRDLMQDLRAENERRRAPTSTGSVAVLPIIGTLAKRGGMIEDASGMMSTDQIGRDLDRALNDSTVSSILLDIDSPGGETFGVQELSDKIYSARGRKPIEASVNPEMASAALWIGSAADRVNITPSGWAGSLGVYMAHTDISAQNEALGEKVTYISAGPYKVEGNPDAPLTEEAAAHFQSQVDAIYAQFVEAVARNRRTSRAKVLENYGGGRMLQAKQAAEVGMVDRIETFDDTLIRMSSGNRKRAASRAAAEWELEAY